ncbi:MAG: protein kinase [Myxococcales bacterium]|nr:protein kinase [Myxococcales bacterium]
MKSCPSCGAQSDDAARFCLECGYAYEAAASEVADPWQGRMVAHRFRIVRKLGDGGMGEVFCAEQVPMGRQVALKVLRQSLSDDPEQVARFKREAQAASLLRHPNTIIVHDFGQDDDGTLFLAMELLEGEPLADVLEREATLEPERAARIMAQVCASLQEAHQRGLVHRDLKPENIFLVDRGAPDFVKVLDFGIAKVTQGSKGEKLESITRAGAVFGTPHYMAPEQIKGEELDARADVYALGVILYRMIAGHLPFDASTVMEMLTKHLTAEPAPIERAGKGDPAARARLEAVALRALSKQPDQRQSSALAFAEDLMAAMPGITLAGITGLTPVVSAQTPALPVAEVATPRAVTAAKPFAKPAAATPVGKPAVAAAVARPATPVAPAIAEVTASEPATGGKGALVALILVVLLLGGGAVWFFVFGGKALLFGPGEPEVTTADAGAADARIAIGQRPDAATVAVPPPIPTPRRRPRLTLSRPELVADAARRLRLTPRRLRLTPRAAAPRRRRPTTPPPASPPRRPPATPPARRRAGRPRRRRPRRRREGRPRRRRQGPPGRLRPRLRHHQQPRRADLHRRRGPRPHPDPHRHPAPRRAAPDRGGQGQQAPAEGGRARQGRGRARQLRVVSRP